MDVLRMVQSQSDIWENFKKNIQNQRLSHAYLFYGEEGVGKKELAYAFACLLYCPHGGCLECEVCKTILDGNHMNVNYLGVEDSKKLISKDQIIALQEEYSKTSLVDGIRIYIVDGIDTASASAQNSLLKFIEEPVNNTPTIGIFIAKELSNVVSTIISRCSLMHFPSLERASLIEMLHEKMDPLDAQLCATLTNDLVEAEQISLQPEYLKIKEFFLDFLMIKTTKDAVLFYVQRSSMIDIKSIKMFFKWLIAFYEDIFMAQGKESLLFTPLYDKIKMYIQSDSKLLIRRFSLILELYSKIDYNVSAKNIFHELITKLY